MDRALPLGWERQGGADVLSLEIRKAVEGLLLAHPPGQKSESVVDGDSEAAATRPPPRLPGSIVLRDRQSMPAKVASSPRHAAGSSRPSTGRADTGQMRSHASRPWFHASG